MRCKCYAAAEMAVCTLLKGKRTALLKEDRAAITEPSTLLHQVCKHNRCGSGLTGLTRHKLNLTRRKLNLTRHTPVDAGDGPTLATPTQQMSCAIADTKQGPKFTKVTRTTLMNAGCCFAPAMAEPHHLLLPEL